MTRFIKSVASLTDGRSRDELEATLASVMFDLIGPAELRLWRLVETEAGDQICTRVRERVRIQRGSPIAVSDDLTETSRLPHLKSMPRLEACILQNARIHLPADDHGLCCSLFPILSDRGPIGVLEVSSERTFGEYQTRLVQGLLQIYRNHIKLLDLSEYDQLTGLLNRRSFDEHQAMLHAALHTPSARPANGDRRHSADGRPCWMAVIDIDFFKRINDHFGHLYGDEVLVLLSRLMRRSFRDTDWLFRFGGEEFVAILNTVDETDAHNALERFRRAVESFGFPQVGRVTVSVGYTRFRPDDSASMAFGRADRALYFSKGHGRNRVSCHETLVRRGDVADLQEDAREVEFF